MSQNEIIQNATEIIIPDGLQINIEEGWKKIISRQFGGNPGRGYGELIQNFLDSYGSDVAWKDRKGEINYGKDWITLRDFGSGLDLKKVKLITTLGGTDKSNDANKIGNFGIGFFSIFNPKLFTREVIITTMCEGHPIEIRIIVKKNGSRPDVKYRLLEIPIDFSTEVKVIFDSDRSVKKCMDYALQCLKYYPCNVTINGVKHYSIWDNAINQDAISFSKHYCDGFIKFGERYNNVTLLCKYEFLGERSLSSFINGGRNMKYNLNDYMTHSTPFVPGIQIAINCSNLSLTISRDSWYLDYNFNNMISDMNSVLFEFLDTQFANLNEQVILANLYIFRNEVRDYLKLGENNNTDPKSRFIGKLINAKIFTINGKKGEFSLNDIKKMKSEDLPMYFTENKANLRWLGGSFKHDFVVLPKPCRAGSGAPLFYDYLFECAFDDAVNLATISSNKKKINDLIDRVIITKDSLEPKCEFMKVYSLSGNEKKLLNKLRILLNKDNVLDAIESSIQLPVKQIKPVFFRLKNKALYISTGLFDDNQKPINDDFISNFLTKKDENNIDEILKKRNTVVLGLCIDHPFIKKLAKSQENHSEFFALTYIAHELTSCQKILSPYSTFYNMVKSKLTMNLRKAMIDEIMN